jgi:hypothetical protein
VSNLQGGLTMQNLTHVSEEQGTWLRLLEQHEQAQSPDPLDIPDDVLDSLVEKGLVRRWRDGSVAITLAGMRAVALH